jgi:hypothetical protein
LETAGGEVITFTPRTDEAEPVELEEAEFVEALSAHARTRRPPAHPQQTARRLFEMDAREGAYLFDARTRRVTPLGPGAHLEGEPSEVDVELTRAYLRWCERTGRKGDCLRLLTEGPTVNGDGRYALAMALAQGAVSTTARGMGGAAVVPVDAKDHEHHIATDKWWDSTNSGGPWSPQFQRIFDKAGMSLNDPANIVRVQGHKGPHPKEYHEEVFERLSEATEDCLTMQQCREALTTELRRLARDIEKPGTELNRLVTRTR